VNSDENDALWVPDGVELRRELAVWVVGHHERVRCELDDELRPAHRPKALDVLLADRA